MCTDSKEETSKNVHILSYVEQLLKDLNCSYEKQTKNDWYEYNFKFQNGNFILHCQENDYFVRIHYPNFFNTTINDLDLVRENCNAGNAHSFGHHIIYTTNGENNRISLHITSSLPFVYKDPKNKELLAENLTRFFGIAQEFYVHFSLTKEKYKDLSTNDIEKDYLKYEREFFMLKETEITHLPVNQQFHLSYEHPLKLSQILSTFYKYVTPELLELKVVTHQLITIVDEEEISNFDISKVLVTFDQKGEPNFSGRNATLILMYYPNRNNTEGYPRQLTLALENEGRTTDTLYMKATLCTPPTNVNNKNMVFAAHNQQNIISFIFAYEKTPLSTKTKELSDFVNQTNKKIETDETEDFNNDQVLLYKFSTPEIQSFREHAESLFHQKRYYETIVEFEYLFNYLAHHYLEFNRSLQNFFYESCYYIGFSYSEIGLYKQAYYYLDIIFPLNNFTYMEEYVNNLIKGKDFRTLSIIDNIHATLANQIQENNGEIPDNVKHFVKFLQRRKAHYLIDIEQYDAARKILELLYKDPECQDYALNELAYLQSITEKKDKSENGSSTNENNSDNK